MCIRDRGHRLSTDNDKACEALKRSEQMLEEDALRFDAFLKENDEKVQEAIKRAEVEAKAKQELARKEAEAKAEAARSRAAAEDRRKDAEARSPAKPSVPCKPTIAPAASAQTRVSAAKLFAPRPLCSQTCTRSTLHRLA